MKIFYVFLLFCNVIGALENTPLLSSQPSIKEPTCYVSKSKITTLLDGIEPLPLQKKAKDLMLPFIQNCNNEYIPEEEMVHFLQENIELTARQKRCEKCLDTCGCENIHCPALYNFFSLCGGAGLYQVGKLIIPNIPSAVLYPVTVGGCFCTSLVAGIMLHKKINTLKAKKELGTIMKNITYSPFADSLITDGIIIKQP